MGQNSHNPPGGINESQKPIKASYERWDLAVLSPEEFRKKYKISKKKYEKMLNE
jgi:hypothetical protein